MIKFRLVLFWNKYILVFRYAIWSLEAVSDTSRILYQFHTNTLGCTHKTSYIWIVYFFFDCLFFSQQANLKKKRISPSTSKVKTPLSEYTDQCYSWLAAGADQMKVIPTVWFGQIITLTSASGNGHRWIEMQLNRMNFNPSMASFVPFISPLYMFCSLNAGMVLTIIIWTHSTWIIRYISNEGRSWHLW